jgi:LacI family transcriptional regulator
VTTISDVARAAGVSTASVSRALSGSRGVRAETLRRVTAAVNRLNYQVNPVASALRGKSTRTVGMVVPDIENPFFPSIVKAVEDALHSSGMSLFLCDARDSVEVEADRLHALLARNVDGLIISPVDATRSRPAVAAAAKHVCLVQVDRCVNADTDVVSVDHTRGIELVVEHLVGTGCDSFAFVTTANRSSIAIERAQAFTTFVRPIDRKSSTRILAGELTVSWGMEAGTRIARDFCPRAVICANDLVAFGVLQALRESGLRVPDDVMVTGYDDLPFAEVTEPRLTSVRQPLEALGREAARFVLSAIEKRGLPRRHLRLLPELSVRESTGGEPGRRRRPGTGLGAFSTTVGSRSKASSKKSSATRPAGGVANGKVISPPKSATSAGRSRRR